MKHLRHFCAATILTFTFALAAFGGDMQCGVVSPPPPAPPASVMDETDPGATATNGESTETSSVDPVTAFTLNLLQGLLSLF